MHNDVQSLVPVFLVARLCSWQPATHTGEAQFTFFTRQGQGHVRSSVMKHKLWNNIRHATLVQLNQGKTRSPCYTIVNMMWPLQLATTLNSTDVSPFPHKLLRWHFEWIQLQDESSSRDDGFDSSGDNRELMICLSLSERKFSLMPFTLLRTTNYITNLARADGYGDEIASSSPPRSLVFHQRTALTDEIVWKGASDWSFASPSPLFFHSLEFACPGDCMKY